MRFATGDVVSRDGTDEQIVIREYEDGLMIHVVCTKAPASGWCAVGEEENNLARRYELIREANYDTTSTALAIAGGHE